MGTTAGVGRSRRALWIAAAVLVPAVLASIGLLWVRPAPEGPGPGRGAPVTAPPSSAAVPTAATAPPPGVVVDRSGVERLLAGAPLLFDGESARLRPATAATVAQLGGMLETMPGVPVRLVGHTADLPGPAERAVRLSRERAEAVAAALLAVGVEPQRITVDGVGDAGPLGTPEASRRVEVLLG
ncbi:OmpA family protein [Pseudonocardia kujensis]|uniref:OmpA family protein n=1 Tax=Pseudonocardia kujensis TaxID=1128675 RepID=UPI001E5904F4|nr:OmpA family protein [Pseudonocardia kujensis]MCE0762643.1 OmpA family protein [Pseudonocardia kujensis]